MIELRVTVWTQHQPNCIGRCRLWLDPTDDRSGRGRRWQQRNIWKISFVRDHPFRTHLCLYTFTHIASHQHCSINQSLCQNQPSSPALGDCQTPSSEERRANVPNRQAFSTYLHDWDHQGCKFGRGNLDYPCHRSLLVRLLRYFVCHWSY